MSTVGNNLNGAKGVNGVNVFDQLVKRMNRYSDLLLAGMVIAIISMIILPMPPLMVDTMIALNIGVAVALLMVSLYISSALSLSTFPTLLLFTTLFRLALNITTTRQILLHADAGKIIQTFGQLVVGGNFVVGAVVFLIITIVQFLVIAKGSERVAEVGARFTLDAMPGKQMSIDADLRAGSIDLAEAKNRRLQLENESKMYGAMDGAMKFVKGDAIAALVITVINIIGGICIGAFQRGMELGAALQKYTVLTIGDGLVSQIPALFISITAGIIVTRVDSDEEVQNLAGEIGQQVITQPKALLIAGAIVAAQALIPGFPKGQFVLLGLGVGVFGLVMFLFKKKVADTLAKKNRILESEESDERIPITPPLSVTVPVLVDISHRNRAAIDEPILNAQVASLEQSFYYETGVPCPGISLRFNDQMPENTYFILVNEIPLYRGNVFAGYMLAGTSEERLKELGIPYDQSEQFLPDMPSIWVSVEYRETLLQNGVNVLDTTQIITHHLNFILRKHGSEFLGISETRYMLNMLESQYEPLVKEVSNLIPITSIAEVLKCLMQEGISVRNLKAVLEAMVEWGQKEKNPQVLAEFARIRLSRYISHKYTDDDYVLHAILLSPGTEDHLSSNVKRNIKETYLQLTYEVNEKLLQQTEQLLQTTGNQGAVVLTRMELRPLLKKLLRRKIPDIIVLSNEELADDISVKVVGRIEL